MSSETITRNDLTNILNDVLPSPTPSPNFYTAMRSSAASTTVSYDVGYDIISTSYKTNTGRFIAIGIVNLRTSRFTSRAVIKVNSVIKGIAGTNSTTLRTVSPIVTFEGVKGETYTVALAIGSQDTGTTAYIDEYNASSFIIFDI